MDLFKQSKINKIIFYSYDKKDDKKKGEARALIDTIQYKLLQAIKPDERLIKSGDFSWGLVKENKVISLIEENRHFCEVLYNYPRKVYFDIDGKDENLNLGMIKNIINKYFNNPKMAISGYETEKKKSYHIILHEIVLKTEDDLNKLKIMISLMKEENESFDDKVYNRYNRAMKCINQSKPHGNIQKIIEDDNKEHHFINSFITGKEKTIEYEITEEMIITPKTLQLLKNDIPKMDLKLDLKFSIDDLKDSLKLLEMTPKKDSKGYLGHAHSWRVGLFCVSMGLTFEEFWNWAKEKGEERRDKWFKYYNIIMNSEFRYSKQGYINYLCYFYPDLVNFQDKIDVSTKNFLDSFNFDTKQIGRIEPVHFETKEKALVFNIGMGGGKTTATIEHLKKTNNSFIWITPRVALADNTNNRMKKDYKMDVVHYKDEKDKTQLNKYKSIIIQGESLHYLNQSKKYNTLVIDEIETVLNNWDCDTTHSDNMVSNFERFIGLMKSSEKVILLDAFITKKTLNLLDNLKISYVIYSSEYKPVERIVKEENNFDKMINNICNDLNNNKKLYIFYCHAKGGKNKYSIQDLEIKINEGLKTPKKIFLMFGEQSDAKKKRMTSDVDEEWSKYDAIITTSSITVGVNYDHKTILYDKVYLFINPLINLPRDILQTSMRIRNPKENNITVYFFNKSKRDVYQYPKNYKTLDDTYKKLIDDISLEKESDFMPIFYKLCLISNYDIKKVHFKVNKEDRNKIQNEYFAVHYSKSLIPYDLISQLKNKDQAEGNVYNYNASLLEKLQLNRYYFDIKFRNFSPEDKKYIFDMNYSSFFKNLNDPLIKLVLGDNDKKSLKDLDLNNISISDATQEYLNEHFKTSTIKKNNQKIIKTLNHILGHIIGNKKSNGKYIYEYNDNFDELWFIHEKYSNTNENYFIDDEECA
jgi:hypothetical protein